MLRLTLAVLFLFVSAGAIAASALDKAQAALSENPPNFDAAIPLLVTGAKRNDPRSLYLLGYLKERGYGTEQDQAGAITLYQAAAQQSFFPAQKRLAELGAGGTLANPDHIARLNRQASQRAERTIQDRERQQRRSEVVSVSGRIIQVLDHGVLVAERDCTPMVKSGGAIVQRGYCSDTGKHIFVETGIAGLADGDSFTANVIEEGVHSYVSVRGAKRTVRKYASVE